MPLDVRREKFVTEYLKDQNATQAAIRAGYSERTAKQQGSRLLSRDDVKAQLATWQAKVVKREGNLRERILRERERLAFYDYRKLYREDGSLKHPHELDEDTAAAVSSFEVVEKAGGMEIGEGGDMKHIPMYSKKVKMADKNPHLTALEKIEGMYSDSGTQTPFNIYIQW